MKKQLLLASGIAICFGLAAQTPKTTGMMKPDLALSKVNSNDGGLNFYSAASTTTRHSGTAATTAQGTLFTSSRNALTLYVSQSNCLTADPTLGAVLFTHRLSADWTPDGNTSNGYIQHTWTTNWANSWDSTYYPDQFNQTDRRFRYPSGAIVNPAGNTNPANAMVVSAGPYTTVGGWRGFYTNHQAMTNASAGAGNTTITASTLNNVSFPRIDITAYSDSTVWLTGGMYVDPNATTASAQGYSGAKLLRAKYNGSAVSWTFDSIVPAFHQDNTGANESYTMTHLAFSADGQIGYCVFFGAPAGQTQSSLRTYLPIVYKTTDGGANWTLQPYFDFSTLPEIGSRLIPATDGNIKAWFSQSEGSDVVVDNNGELHIVCVIESGATNDDDSLGYFWVLTGQNGTSARHYIYDVHTSGSTWGAVLVDSLMTSVSTNTTIFFDDVENQAVPTDARIQIASTADRTKLFYTWVDSDPLASSGENAAPDLYGKAWDLSTGMWTMRKQFTNSADFYFHFMSNVALVNGTTYRIGVTNSRDRDGQSLTTTPWNHYFFDQCTFDQSEFVGVEEHEAAFGKVSTYPNPANEQLNLELDMVEHGDVSIALFNTVGQQVMQEKRALSAGNNIVRLNTAALPAGVYLLNVASGSSVVTAKVVIE